MIPKTNQDDAVPRPTVKSAFALAVLLGTMPGAATHAGQAAPAAAAVPQDLELLELDEVIVHGERLIDRIVKAEDEFYKIYNQVNRDDRYDVSCPHLNVSADAGSRISSRLCLPGFVADAIADFAVFKVNCEPEFANFDANRDGRISRMEAAVNGDLQFQFDQLDQDDDDHLERHAEFRNFETWAAMNQNCYRPPPPELVLMEGTDDWYKHMLAVTNSDPRLSEMAGKLDDMHRELTSVQRRYRDMAQAEADANYVDRTPNMRQSGPRRR
jgi:hypothetical protein